MVMEEPPSPQCVGREFVRQYYTLLNKAPIHLHRFYNNVSSFVHGGLDAPDRETAPVIGQKEIHNRIQQLNFRDCHAKISQVDSQATLGNGVVVQVTGELSNGGQPMRRFTQTFVLAAQSPKQYYVHNDIFRYQDFVFSDEDGEWEYSRSDDAPQQPPPAAMPAPYFPPPAPSPPPPPLHHHAINGHQDDVPGNLSIPLTVSDTPCEVDVSQELEVEDEEPPPPPVPAPLPPMPVHEPVPVVSSEPKTYANLVKSGPPGSFAQAIQQHVTTAPQTVPGAGRVAPSSTRTEPTPPPSAPAQQRPRPQRGPRTDSNSDTGGGQGGGSPPAASSGRRYSDSHQLFLGNLPHNATKEELKTLFEKFGAIADLRVYSKPAQPTTPGLVPRQLPNYAFLTFEEPQSAQHCLNYGSLYFPSVDSPEATLLNIQEKKSRPSGGGGGGGGGRGAGGRGGARPPRPAFSRGPYQPRR